VATENAPLAFRHNSLSKGENILIVGPSWVGDMVMAQSLFKFLKAENDDCTIDVIAPAWSMPVLSRMPEVRELIRLPAGHGQLAFNTRYNVARALRNKNYTRAIVLPRSWKSALTPWLAKVPVRTGYRGEYRYGLLNDVRRLDKSILTQTVQRYVALGLASDPNHAPATPYPQLQVERDNMPALLGRLELNAERPVVGLLPGAEYGPAKCWPLDNYVELARQIIATDRAIWVFGSDRDKESGKYLSENVDGVINLCGKTSIGDAIDLLSVCQSIVTNDSGLMHIACAVGVQVHAIYGSSSPAYTPPLSDSAEIYYAKEECSPCFKRTCRFDTYACLHNVRVQDVAQRVIGMATIH